MKTILHLNGRAGDAYKGFIDPTEFTDPAHVASLSIWIIFVPGQSPAWGHYVLCGVHLREIEGVRPPVKRFPDATHEVMLFALDPELGNDLRPENFFERKEAYFKNTGRSGFLDPCNYVGQVRQATDATFTRIVDMMAESIVNGVLPAEGPLSGKDYWTSYVLQAQHLIEVHPEVLEGQGKSLLS